MIGRSWRCSGPPNKGAVHDRCAIPPAVPLRPGTGPQLPEDPQQTTIPFVCNAATGNEGHCNATVRLSLQGERSKTRSSLATPGNESVRNQLRGCSCIIVTCWNQSSWASAALAQAIPGSACVSLPGVRGGVVMQTSRSDITTQGAPASGCQDRIRPAFPGS
jgi:hypothetical protein